MRINNVFSGRPAFYDRNPTHVKNGYINTGLAPAGFTQRFIYTVPSARKAIVQVVQNQSSRTTAATTAGLVEPAIIVNTAVFTTSDIITLNWISNVLGFEDRGLVGAGTMLLAGDDIAGWTGDLSTAGTVAFDLSANAIEFDA